MKKHLVMICGVYYPEPSPTGLCAKRFASLMLDEYDIEIISVSDNGVSETVVDGNGITVHTLSGRRLSAEKKAKGLTKKILHTIGAVQIKTAMLGNMKWYERATFKKLEQINGERKIDVIFSLCSPMAAHCAALRYKKKKSDVRWCAYTVDPYSSAVRIRPIACSHSRLVSFERGMIEKSDALLLSEEVYENRPDLRGDSRKCTQLPYMLPKERCVPDSGINLSPNSINCVYGGRFYPLLRDPEKMLQSFSNLKGTNIKLHLFSVGCEETVKKYSDSSQNIIQHKQVSHDDIADIYSKADVLISVGNNSKEFFPSKIFEYIVTGKPIVHFYGSSMKDMLLEKYPHVLQIDNNSDDICSDAIERFACEFHGKNVERDQIEEIYLKHTETNIRAILSKAFKG